MRYVKHIGRIGGLAVGLGVGAAVASLPGVAFADTTDADSTTTSSTVDSSTDRSSTGDNPTSNSSPTPTKPTSQIGSSPTNTADDDLDPDPTDNPTKSTTDTAADAVLDTTTTDAGIDTTTAIDTDPDTDTDLETDAESDTGPQTLQTTSSRMNSFSATPPTALATPMAQPSGLLDTVEPLVGSLPQYPSIAPISPDIRREDLGVPRGIPFDAVLLLPAATWQAFWEDKYAIAALPVAYYEVVFRLIDATIGPFLEGEDNPVGQPLMRALMSITRNDAVRGLFGRGPIEPIVDLPTLASPNLLVNPDAEAGDPSYSGYAAVTIPGWTLTGTPTVIPFNLPRRWPWPTATPGPTLPTFLKFASAPDGTSGNQFFGGGPVADSTLTQTVNLRAASDEIDAGGVAYQLTGDLGGSTIDPSRTSVTVDFLDVDGNVLGQDGLTPVTAFDRGFYTGWVHRQLAGTIPAGTRSAVVVVTFDDRNPVLGNYNNASADNLSFTVDAAGLAPAALRPPPSTVGQLDHIFMTYMENKGYYDIEGSRGAPYLNSLMQQYGNSTNYFALTHPSDPNYTPILGGSDFGLNYNCPHNCYDRPNLADRIEAADLNWGSYVQGGGGYTTPTDRVPFLAFANIYNNRDRVAEHMFDIDQLADDLQSPATTPNFVWFQADDDNNMEGPSSGLGVIRWLISQLTFHQYNVSAGDQFLAEQVPVIMESEVWKDPDTKSAIFITLDEDYNNLSAGIGNQANRIVMVVIPSPGAQKAGMIGGPFVVDEHYNHYSLLRTIEESLGGLPPLTNSDRYAVPMNEFWETS